MKFNNLKITTSLALILFAITACEREVSDDAVPATFPSTGDIFTDAPVSLTDEFFISFDPAAGANTEGFGTDENEAFEGISSIRIDVPASNDPNGNFIGGIFRDRGEGRNLSQYDALTFYAKGSVTGTIGAVGFGTDFLEGKFPVSRVNIQLTTDWKKYVIPIPDASKLVQEKGMFLFAAGGFDILGDGPNGNEVGWTFWMDEIRFETLGTNLSVSSQILNGQDQVVQSFTNTEFSIAGCSQIVNLASGENVMLDVAPAYFDYTSSNDSAATVEDGVVIVGASGTTTITAALNGELAQGSIEITSNGEFPLATTPTRPASSVISLFSDAYDNVPVRHYNGFFQFATTQGGAGADPNNVDIQVPLDNGMVDNIINYTNLNFVSIGTYETVALVDASAMTHIHIDINIRDVAIDGGDFIRLSLESNTGVGSVSAGDFILSSSDLAANEWLSLDIPLSNFSGLTDFSAIGQLFFVSDATISSIYVDNVYFYAE